MGLDKIKAAMIFTILFAIWLGLGGLIYLGLELRQNLRASKRNSGYVAIGDTVS
jgi:hypothetical protein